MQDSHAPENIFKWKVRDDDPNAVEILGLDDGLDSKELTELTVPNEIDGKRVVAIGDRAFYRRSSLTAIRLPEGLTTIGDRAFYHCFSLTAIKLPEGVTTIGEGAFFRIPDDCVFYVYPGTYAYRWAIENGYDVVIRRRD